MVFYSGDTDGAVPTYGSKRWIKDLNWPVKTPWQSWVVDDQVAGFVVEYEGNFRFITVKGVGHMAPQYARKQVTHMINAIIHGEKL